MLKIAIFGANSELGKDLILSFSNQKKYFLSLFCRNPSPLKNWLSINSLPIFFKAHDYSEFSRDFKYDVIINFVGAGNPEKVRNLGKNIIKVTNDYDNIVVNYLNKHSDTKYIFISSGAVYGESFEEAIKSNTVNIKNIDPENWYALSKFNSELKHRELSNFNIIDVRVFNYFSHTQNLNSKFLITEIIKALKDNTIFKTSPDNIVRDYISSVDFYHLIQSIIDYKPINTAIDCYSKSPVSKFDLLSKLHKKYGLNFEIINESKYIKNKINLKKNYYSKNKFARKLGYSPINDSMSNLMDQIDIIINNYS